MSTDGCTDKENIYNGGNFLEVPWLGLSAFRLSLLWPGFNPWSGILIPQATWHSHTYIHTIYSEVKIKHDLSDTQPFFLHSLPNAMTLCETYLGTYDSLWIGCANGHGRFSLRPRPLTPRHSQPLSAAASKILQSQS